MSQMVQHFAGYLLPASHHRSDLVEGPVEYTTPLLAAKSAALPQLKDPTQNADLPGASTSVLTTLYVLNTVEQLVADEAEQLLQQARHMLAFASLHCCMVMQRFIAASCSSC